MKKLLPLVFLLAIAGIGRAQSLPQAVQGQSPTGQPLGFAPVVGGGVYNSSHPSPWGGQLEPLQIDSNGNLYVDIATGTLSVTQGTAAAMSAPWPVVIAPGAGAPCSSSSLGSAGASVTATATGASGKSTWITSLEMSCTHASAAGTGTGTLSNIIGSSTNINFAIDEETGFGFYFAQTFTTPLQSYTTNV